MPSFLPPESRPQACVLAWEPERLSLLKFLRQHGLLGNSVTAKHTYIPIPWLKSLENTGLNQVKLVSLLQDLSEP